jgi:hypothetical protein
VIELVKHRKIARAIAEKESSVSTVEARALVFRVARDPALLNQLHAVALTHDCAELGRLVTQLDANVSLADCIAVRPEFERATDVAELRAAHPAVDHAAIAQVAATQPQPLDALAWMKRAAYAVANVCTA